MRRWNAFLKFLKCRQLRFCEIHHPTYSHIKFEVGEALRRLQTQKTFPAWVAISKVSSFLSEETREALAEMGGLAGFCRMSAKQNSENAFEVKMVDGVLCVKLKVIGNNDSVKRKRNFNSKSVWNNKKYELYSICSIFPDKPVTLETCQRVWKLSTIEETKQLLIESMIKLKNILKEESSSLNMTKYIQVGYEGKEPIVVAYGSKASLIIDECIREKISIKKEENFWNSEDFAPQYDLWRLSRFLRTDGFVSCEEVIKQTLGVLQTSIIQIALTYPERISLQLSSSIKIEDAIEGHLYINGEIYNEIYEIIGIKFLLSEEEIRQHLKTSCKFSNLTDEQLREERAKLKNIPPLRRQKNRKLIVREELRRRFPQGNPFLNSDVVAFHLYDIMPSGVWTNSAIVRESLLPDGGKSSLHVGVDFFDKYPHLFITQSITTTSINVMKREQNMENIQSDGESWKNGFFSDEDILLFLLPRLTDKKEDWGDKSVEVITSLLPRHVFKYMKLHGCPSARMLSILKQYPEAFELVEVPLKEKKLDQIQYQNTYYRLKVHLNQEGIAKIGAKLVNKFQNTKNCKDSKQDEKKEKHNENSDGESGVAEIKEEVH